MNPELSSTELLVKQWLDRKRIPYVMQQDMMGGTSEAGGARVDFLLDSLNIIIRVMSYFHTLSEAVARDKLQKIALVGQGYNVVDVWEKDLEANLNRVMVDAIKGKEW